VVADGAREGLLTAARYEAVSRVLGRVLLFNVTVALAKLALGYATGTVSVVSDGYHSIADSASNVIGLIGLRYSRKPPDVDHPYGHRKFETLAAGGIFMFLVLAVVEIGRTAIKGLGSAEPPHVSWISFAVMLATLGINLGVVRYEGAADRVVIDEEQIRDAVMGVPDVLGCHHIRTRGSFDYVFLDLHVWLPADAPLRDAHRVSHVVKDRLMERFPQIADAIIHIEPPPFDR